jgi:2-polyprenyl-6-methoxyphenol hydroxylase-like FAD-dependent oxidoreductase
MAKQTISIIGAGIGGLTVGRCLKQRGIPAILYDRSSSPPSYNYGITLYASTYISLLKALGVTENVFRSRVAVDAANGGTGKISDVSIGAGSNRGDCFRANRGKLEEWLREGLDVRWEHALQQVDQSSNKATLLHFENGQTIESDIIVGVDGVHSSLRKSLLPKSELDILPFVVFNGKRRIERPVYEEKIAPHLKDSNVINFKDGNSRINFNISDYDKGKVSVSWTYSRPSRGDGDALHKPGRELSKATVIPEELFEELDQFRHAGLPPPFSDLFRPETVRNDRILHWLMRATHIPKEDLQNLAEKGIVLMGDAAHAHPIVGGNGANIAIEDAVHLAEHITAMQNTNDHGFGDWISQRYQEWTESIQTASKNIERLHYTQAQRL